jgi:amino acid transporter
LTRSQALWSYVGFSNTLYAAGELKNPTRTIRRMGPIVIGGVAVLYVLIQVAYFAAVPREQILASTQVSKEKMPGHVHGD